MPTLTQAVTDFEAQLNEAVTTFTTLNGVAGDSADIAVARAQIAVEKAAEALASRNTVQGIAASFGTVQTAIDGATAQAGIATTGAGTATTQAGISTAQAGLAAAAKTAAEAARDASFALGPKYTTEALGRAAVADGANFLAQGAGPIAAFEYRRINAGTASTLIAMYPAVGAVSDMSLFTRTGYLNTSGVLSATGDANWKTTELLSVYYLDVKAVSLYGTTANASLAYYDANSVFISGVVVAATGDLVTAYTPPVGAVFVAMTRNNQVANDGKQWLFADIKLEKLSLLPTVATTANVDYPTIAGTSDLSWFTRSGYLNTAGVLTADANHKTTELLPVYYLDVKTMSLRGLTVVSSIAFYDTGGIFISGVIAATNGASVTTYPAPPATAVYVAFTANIQAIYYSQNWFFADIKLDKLAPPASPAAAVPNTDYAKYALLPGFIGLVGEVASTDATWLYSDFIPVAAGDVIACDMFGNLAVNCLSFYTPGKQYSSGFKSSSNTLPGVRFKQDVAVPIDGYVRVSFGNPATNTSAAAQGPAVPFAKTMANFGRVSDKMREALIANSPGIPYKSPRKLKLLSTDKVLLYGDSISSNAYPWYAEAVAALTGAIVSAGGFPGMTAAQLADDAKLQAIYDYGARLVVVMVGGNDLGSVGTVGTFDGSVPGELAVAERSVASNYNPSGSLFIHAVSHIMRRFKAQYENIRTRAALTGSETEAEKTAKIDAVLKPVLVFCTTIPQNYGDSSNVRSQMASWLRKRAAVIECSRKYGVHCVDLTSMVPWNMSLEPYFVGPSNTVNNFGVKTMDGLHPNKYGFQDMADIVCADVGL